ncbi:adenine deaminase [Shouchella miscanthi]|uniref:Adenine deaminase n=1 Tax=Shouchella miscanthi TaxID=2598861 RepID=A0ABU6NJW5_9BACI|nr:adenine deaminase [Shouchella miscanthi]MED4128375.1 adenine deaminase [Shouchella miscanthi]
MSEPTSLKNQLRAASGEQACDLLLQNATIVDVYTCSTFQGNIAITDGIIVGIGAYTSGKKVVDVKGKWICPSLIDGHVHIESGMVRPEELARVLIPRGVTTIIADPHEIANVGGADAVRYMIEASKDMPLDIKMMVPSSVPAASFEENGATLSSKDADALFKEGNVYGLGEVMDYPAVCSGDDEMLRKISLAKTAGHPIDGHGSGLGEKALNAYRVVGIENDHEAITAEEALERVRKGFYVLMREGTATRDMEAIIPSVTPFNCRRFAFATDDKHLDDLIEEGSIDFNVRKAIELGLNPLQAIQLGSLNAAECFRLQDRGAIAPGKKATFLVVNDLNTFEVDSVYVEGEKVAEKGTLLSSLRSHVEVPLQLLNSVRVKPFTKENLELPLKNSDKATIIEASLTSIVTKKAVEKVEIENNCFKPNKNQLKLVVMERHHQKGTIGVGICKGIPIKKGAIVSTVAHDSHNIIACGVDDDSLYHAINHVVEIGGGMAVVDGDRVIATLPLAIGGLMSTQSTSQVKTALNKLQEALKVIGYHEEIDPFLTLAFLALPVIPSIKLTSKGLFDVEAFSFIEQ